MTRIDTFSGAADELADFISHVWADSYAGKMTFIRWTPEYLQWQLRLGASTQQTNHLAAYDGSTLVGVMLGIGQSYRCESEVVHGSHWSWLSVLPAYRGRGIVKALDEARLVRQRACGSKVVSSFRYVGAKQSQAKRPDRQSPSEYSTKLGFWVRVLKPTRFSHWHFNRAEALLGLASGPLAPTPREHHKGCDISRFVPADLDECLELVHESQSAASFCLNWDRESLTHQLSGSPLSHTLVLKEAGKVCGLVNFHVLPFQARSIENVGIIDLIAFRGSSAKKQSQLLDAALAVMSEMDVIMALKLRCGDAPVTPLLRNWFVPRQPETFLVLRWMEEARTFRPNGPVSVLWR